MHSIVQLPSIVRSPLSPRPPHGFRLSLESETDGIRCGFFSMMEKPSPELSSRRESTHFGDNLHSQIRAGGRSERTSFVSSLPMYETLMSQPLLCATKLEIEMSVNHEGFTYCPRSISKVSSVAVSGCRPPIYRLESNTLTHRHVISLSLAL